MLLGRESLMYDYLQPAAVQQLLEQHRSRQQDHHKVLFSLVLLEQWLRQLQSPPSHTAGSSADAAGRGRSAPPQALALDGVAGARSLSMR
jgi:hypothetical protein